MSSPCQFKCYFDKELQRCGTCHRTLEEIRDAGIRFKQRQQEICEEKLYKDEDS
jgi:predicted Fe-S protein YdhL (DUF1289 family)